MTGYGRAEGKKKGIALTVELRSVNHRYCDVALRLPKLFAPLEETLTKLLKQRIKRGHVDLIVNLNMPLETGLELDISAANTHYNMLLKLKKELGLPGEVSLDHLMRLKDFIVHKESLPVEEVAFPVIIKSVEEAIDDLNKVRIREGRALLKDIEARIRGLAKVVLKIEAQYEKGFRERHQRLLKKTQELAGGLAIDPQRLAQEVALLASRSDISEEVSRLKTHLVEFGRLLYTDNSVGRGLDFLTQEIGREINTLGAKANDEKIALQVVAMKCEMEKVREQVQNIE
jgi:uncharacterized protein (TIGR00255 family)